MSQEIANSELDGHFGDQRKAKPKGNGKAAARVDADLSSAALHKKVIEIRTGLNGEVIGRSETIDMIMHAFVCQEHGVLIGPPGTAKSMVTEALISCVTDARYARRLFHKAMTPDEIFGGLDLKRFQNQGIVSRVFKGTFAEAEAIFADEAFKGNTLVLNSMLTLMEERHYEDQAGRHELPVRSLFGASNEFPQDAILGALYDRFLFRHVQQYLQSRSDRKAVIHSRANRTKQQRKFKPPVTMCLAEWDAIHAHVQAVKVDDRIEDAMLDFQDSLATHGMIVSDRRMLVKAVDAIKAAAWLDGEDEASVDHLQVLRFVLWDTPDQREKVLASLKGVARTEAGKAVDKIDALLREHAQLPDDSVARDRALPDLYGRIKATGKDIKKELDRAQDGKKNAFGVKGSQKVRRRMVELTKAYKSLLDDFDAQRHVL